MCLERPLEQALSGSPVSMTGYNVYKGYDFDFKYGTDKEDLMQDSLQVPSRSPTLKVRRKHHRRKGKGKKRFRLPSTFFEPSLENIDEEKEIEIDPLRLSAVRNKMSTKHRERTVESGSDGRRFRHRHYIKREKAST